MTVVNQTDRFIRSAFSAEFPEKGHEPKQQKTFAQFLNDTCRHCGAQDKTYDPETLERRDGGICRRCMKERLAIASRIIDQHRRMI